MTKIIAIEQNKLGSYDIYLYDENEELEKTIRDFPSCEDFSIDEQNSVVIFDDDEGIHANEPEFANYFVVEWRRANDEPHLRASNGASCVVFDLTEWD